MLTLLMTILPVRNLRAESTRAVKINAVRHNAQSVWRSNNLRLGKVNLIRMRGCYEKQNSRPEIAVLRFSAVAISREFAQLAQAYEDGGGPTFDAGTK